MKETENSKHTQRDKVELLSRQKNSSELVKSNPVERINVEEFAEMNYKLGYNQARHDLLIEVEKMLDVMIKRGIIEVEKMLDVMIKIGIFREIKILGKREFIFSVKDIEDLKTKIGKLKA